MERSENNGINPDQVTEATAPRPDPEILPVVEIPQADIANKPISERLAADDVRLAEVRAQFDITTPEMAALKMEKEGFACEAPSLEDQIADPDRNALITRVISTRAIGKDTSRVSLEDRETVTEHDALVSMQRMLTDVANNEAIRDEIREAAKEMSEKMSWVGEKEYTEAVTAIAESWKHQLRENPDLVIVPVVGMIARGSYSDETDPSRPQVKSDEWMLENILAKFSDKELEEFAKRITLDRTKIPEDIDKTDLKIVVMDDWTMTGFQLGGVSSRVMSSYPQFAESIEVQMIIAREDMLSESWEVSTDQGKVTVPVKAYFRAHSTDNPNLPTGSISGSHSSADAGFENIFPVFVEELNRVNGNNEAKMPQTTNIVRPYRGMELVQRQRLEAASVQ